MAMIDPLTGLFNRRAFFERLEGEVQRCQRLNIPISIIMLDVDNFKSINDTYGHQVGDLVLQRVSTEIKGLVRIYDIVGRYGGEEFIVCLPGADAIIAAEIAERLRESLEKMNIYLLNDGNKKINITASFGYTSADTNTDMCNIDYHIKKADEAVYLAKKQGKNRVCKVE
jgi:two-component system chemotaxis response regulator CheY